ncbi:M23 family metallopeptidase [Luteolibacter yonseiensis]|uniref:M23 family metallopeptidase n=1 Tax=Luteolibacter yonseiensis TaxID=1144680 RepID=A0A934R8U2_9BACT|nr:M23 family metallopeptidase [Luteolibacter yonseiensis]MBK1818432.1 M23 family metallopeptidase [Luteolibacter yonseiensis]
MFRTLVSLLSLATVTAAAPIDLRLPTENHHLFTGEMDRFYMYVDRNFEGQQTKPWEAGSFGLVRTAIRVNGEVLLTKFHEGIDISPVKRDKAGNPLDLVSSIADGRVVYVSPIAGRSNYGKYVVIEHSWENSQIISLYAHLAEITAKPGDEVKAGSVIGRMGYTGAGIDRTRAHCHLEIGMLMSSRYMEWHQQFGGGTNYHGLFNGMNICGADAARFFLDHKANPELQFSQYIASTPVYFKVAVPAKETPPEFVKRYPWIVKGDTQGAASWEISFSATGLPLAFERSQRDVTVPVVTSVRPSTVPQRYMTRNLISGEGNKATLTNGGRQLVSLLTDDFPHTP